MELNEIAYWADTISTGGFSKRSADMDMSWHR
jgi:hypothetical protein